MNQQNQTQESLDQTEADRRADCVMQISGPAEPSEQSKPKQIVESGISLSTEGLRKEEHLTSEEEIVQLFHKEAVGQASGREEEWLNKVRLAHKQLALEGKPITINALCRTIPVARSTLTRYSQTKAFLAGVLQESGCHGQSSKALLREEALTAKVQNAISHLKTLGQLVTPAAIAEYLHLSVGILKSYPSVRPLLDQVSIDLRRNRAKQHKAELVQQVAGAIRLLESQGQKVTIQALEEILHIPLIRSIYLYPELKRLWQQTQAEQACQQRVQREQREEQLLGKAKKIFSLLELQGSTITATAIARQMGMSLAGLRYYQQVSMFVNSCVEANRASLR